MNSIPGINHINPNFGSPKIQNSFPPEVNQHLRKCMMCFKLAQKSPWPMMSQDRGLGES